MNAEVIESVLVRYQNSNLASEAARKVLAQEIMNAYELAKKVEAGPQTYQNTVLPE